MKYIITGATGFLGSALCDTILAESSENVIYAACRKRHLGQMPIQ